MSHFISHQQIWAALAAVPDPEIPVVSVVEMGMVRQVNVENNKAIISFTPTFSGCPAIHVIKACITEAVFALGIKDLEIQTTFSPPWSSDWILPEARQRLRKLGIAPPGLSGKLILTLEPDFICCPRCESFDVQMTASFGSTLCKRLYVCSSCKEPFEAFKTV